MTDIRFLTGNQAVARGARCWGPFGFMPIFEPGDAAEALAMTKAAFALSEDAETPVLVRLFDKTAHMAGQVELGEREERPVKAIQRRSPGQPPKVPRPVGFERSPRGQEGAQ